MIKKRGLFIVFEGIDGSGKSTQIEKLGSYIRKHDKYQDVLFTREPTFRADEIRAKLRSDSNAFSDGERMAKLFIEDRKMHTYDQIVPNLNQRILILCDRYSMSTCAYQSTQGISIEKLFKFHLDAEIITPDLTFYIDASKEISIKRRIKRGEPMEKFEKDEEFNKRLREQYLLLAEMINKKYFLARKVLGDISVINGNNSRKKVASDIVRAFQPIYDAWKVK